MESSASVSTPDSATILMPSAFAVSTIFWGEGCVSLSQTSTIIDDGEITLSLEELLAKIAECEGRITTAESQATASATAAANAEQSAVASAAAAVEAGNSAVTVKEACEAATVAANEAADRANAAADRSAVLTRVEAVETQAAANAEAIADNAAAIADNAEAIATKADASAIKPTTLWSGTGWESGSITVEGIGDWKLLQIGLPIGYVLAVNGSVVQGIGISTSATMHRTLSVRFSVSGNTCTLATVHYIDHSSGSNHGAITKSSITSIVGLIKGGA